MKIVTFYTPMYKGLADQCVKSGEKFGYRIIGEQIPDTGSWLRNTAQKANIVSKYLNMYDEFIITDADSLIKDEINFGIFDGWEFAARIKGGNELLSGTMFFRPTDRMFEIVAEWKDRCEREHRIIEQMHLHRVLIHRDFKFLRLPAEYCAIYDEDPRVENPVIEHYQASRTYKRLLRG